MLNFLKKNQTSNADQPSSLIWDPEASAGIQQALKQVHIPKILTGRIKKELRQAAEDAARADGRAHVTSQDVLSGMLAKMPADMRQQVTKAMQEGNPDELKKLGKKLRGGL